MPELSRLPSGPYEERIDFDRVANAQARRHRDTLAELRAVLLRSEARTLQWAKEEIVRKKRKTAVAKYTMPLFMKYREVLRRKTLSSNRRGRSDSMKELGLRTPAMRQPSLARARARADALAGEHRTRLESDIRRELTSATEGIIDGDVIAWTIRQVFAEFAGWAPPEAP
jgi:hypothetical protein